MFGGDFCLTPPMESWCALKKMGKVLLNLSSLLYIQKNSRLSIHTATGNLVIFVTQVLEEDISVALLFTTGI